VAIRVENLSKTFHIPHEKISTLKGAALGLFSKKNYTEFKALENVNFEVKKGEFFGIIGRNGSGKSTLLKILTGIYVPNTGKITINGKLSPFLELGVGFNQELTGRENVFLGGSILGLTKEQINEKYDRIIEFSELGEFIDMKLKNYSSGMQVRLAFSLAINVYAEILLMDEVLAVGDSNFQKKCLEEFNKYRSTGKTVVLVTHDMGVMQRYCDKAMLLESRKIVKIGLPEEVAREYLEQNRVSTKNKKSKTVEQKSKTAEVCEVSLADKTGKIKEIFGVNETIVIKVIYKIYKKVEKPILGITIRDMNGNDIFITNTSMKKVSTGVYGGKSQGTLNTIFEVENVLAPGKYFVSPAIANKEGEIFYDWKDDISSFKVINRKYQSGGIVDLEHKIMVKE